MAVLDLFSLKGKVALITGGSYGIGFEIAKALSEAGATICFNDRNEETLQRGYDNYNSVGIKAHGYICDVTNEEQVQNLVKTIVDDCLYDEKHKRNCKRRYLLCRSQSSCRLRTRWLSSGIDYSK